MFSTKASTPDVTLPNNVIYMFSILHGSMVVDAVSARNDKGYIEVNMLQYD